MKYLQQSGGSAGLLRRFIPVTPFSTHILQMVKYMKKKDRHDEVNYQDFMGAQRRHIRQERQRFKPFNRLALNALNTANVIPQSVCSDPRVTYV